MIRFTIHGDPPTATAQMRKIRVVGGKPQTYKPQSVKEAEAWIMVGLAGHAPAEPITGPVHLVAVWAWQCKGRRKPGYRTTRPDTDNLQKLLKDCMTQMGFWKDDAQVVTEYVCKCWVDKDPGISIEIREEGEEWR